MSKADKELDLIMDEVETMTNKNKREKRVDMDKIEYKNTIRAYNEEIKKLKLLKRHAKITYKLSKMEG